MSMLLLECGGAGAWTPAALPGLAPSLSIALQRQRGLLWQDSGKTTPATANNDPVRVATCPWTGVDYTAPSDAARPLLYDETGGKWSLSFDGVDDVLVIASAFAVQFVSTRALYPAASFTGFPGLFSGVSGDPDAWLIGSGTASTVFYQGLANISYYRFNGVNLTASAWTAPVNGVPGTSCFAKTVQSPSALMRVGSDRGIVNRYWSGRVPGVVPTSATPSAGNLLLLESYLGAL